MATKYIGDNWKLSWSDLYSSQVVVLYKIGPSGTWVQITNTADNGITGDPYSGEYNWTIDLTEDTLEVYCRVADKGLWDSENPDDGEYVDYGPFDIEERVLSLITISPSSTRVKIGSQKRFYAVGYDQTGTELTIQSEFTWSTDAVHGSINTQGLFTAGETPEECTVTAEMGELSATANVSVMEKVSESGTKSSLDSRGSFTKRRSKWRGL